MRGIFAIVLIWTALTAAIANAAPYRVDKDHAHLTFACDHLGFSLVRGRFNSYEAAIDFNSENPENSSVRIVIDANSIETYSATRDGALRSAKFLDTARYPTIEFTSVNVRRTGPNTAEVMGNLTIRGVTLPHSFTAQLRRLGVSELTGLQTAGFSVKGLIDRTRFGIDFGAPAIGADLAVSFDFEAILAQ